MILLPGIGLVASQYQSPTDSFIYEKFITLASPPIDSRILLVAIDDASITAIGRWPWPRKVHTQLLNKLAPLTPKAVLYDATFTERAPDPQVDERLGNAMEQVGVVLLPPLRNPKPHSDEPTHFLEPIRPVAQSAKAIGHLNIAAKVDGTVHSVYPTVGYFAGQLSQLTWPTYAAAFPANNQPTIAKTCCVEDVNGHWFGWNEVFTPFSGSSRPINMVSAIDVLSGNFSPSSLQDKIILVGVTASTLGERYATPLATSAGPMSEVVVQAQLLNNHLIKALPTWMTISLSVASGLIVLGLFLTFRLRQTFLVCMSTIFASLTLSLVLLTMGGWSSPGAGSLGAALAYLFWCWRRLNAVVPYSGLELNPMAQELKPSPTLPKPTFHGDELIRHAPALEAMNGHVSGSQPFTAQILDRLPLALFVTDLTGRVLQTNNIAATLHSTDLRDQRLINKNIFQIMGEIEHPNKTKPVTNERPWHHSNEHNVQLLADQVLLTSTGRSFKIQLAPLDSEKSKPSGWLISLLEFNEERMAQEQRDSMLRFLSHDLRAPQSAILALLAMQESCSDPLPANELRRQIEHQIKRTLSLTDSLLLLDASKSKSQLFENVFLGSLVMDALDQVWPLAQNKNIRFEHTFIDDERCEVNGSRELLTRAIFNMLENAVKYSEPFTTAHLQMNRKDDEVLLVIRDAGRGISKEDLPRLFDEFCQLGKGNSRGAGYGLGMAFVSNVIQQHSARIECSSELNVGTTFRLYFRAV